MNHYRNMTFIENQTKISLQTKIGNNNRKNKPRQHRKQQALDAIWNEYITHPNNQNIEAIRRYKRKENKYRKRLEPQWMFPSIIENAKTPQKKIYYETIQVDEFNCDIADDLSRVLPKDREPNYQIIMSNVLFFRRPICYEEDRTVDVILQCGHCLCKSCHFSMQETVHHTYDCPMCRKCQEYTKIEFGPTLQYCA